MQCEPIIHHSTWSRYEGGWQASMAPEIRMGLIYSKAVSESDHAYCRKSQTLEYLQKDE